MSQLLTVNEHGLLVNGNGEVVGRIVSIELDLTRHVQASSLHGREEGIAHVPTVDHSEQGKSPTGGNEESSRGDGGVGETPSAVARVWAHYQATIPGANRQALDGVKRRVIEKALKVRTVEQCCQAIDGLAASPHHNGQNDRHKKYLGIRYALKGNSAKGEGDDERVDKMAEILPSAGGDLLAAVPSAGREMVQERQRLVEATLLNPGDGHRRARAGDSQSYLEETFGLYARVADGTVRWTRDVMRAARAGVR